MEHRFAALDPLLEEALAAGLGSAATLSVGSAGREVYRCCLGRRWRVPEPGPVIDGDTWFDLASLTKPLVTAALAMALFERGRLDLDAPVRRYLGDAVTPGTVAQLLGHAAGMAPHVRFFEQLAAGERAGQSSARAALIHLACRHPLTYAPGQATVYSDLGYLVLGHVLECVGDARLDELWASQVAEPLEVGAHFPGAEASGAGADDRAYVATELEPAGLVCGQVHDENARAGGGVFGHAGLFGRIDDVARMAAAMTALGGGWLRADTVQRFFSTAAGPGSWRLGWDTPSATPGVSHAGDLWPRHGAVGHLGFTGTSLWLAPAQGRWVALLTNRVHPTRDGTADGIKLLRRAVMDQAWRALEAS